MTKISFISGAFPPITGGEVYNYKLYFYLQNQGLDIKYVNLHKIRWVFKFNLIPIVGDFFCNLVVFLLIFYRLGDMIIEDQYFSPYLILTNFYHKFIKKNKILLIVHHFDRYTSQIYGINQRQFWSYPLAVIRELSSVFFADKVVTNSQFNKQEILAIRSIEENAIKVLSPGLERSNFQNRETKSKTNKLQDEKERIVLCVGHCIPRKGIIYLVEAFSKVNNLPCKLYIVGKTDKDIRYYYKVQSLVEKLKLSGKIQILNRVDTATLISLYSQADFFVLPSLKEGFGIVLLEAMYYGLPIITTNVSAMPELVVNGENGLLVSAANTNELSKALLTLLNNPKLRNKMSENALKKIEQSYYWEETQSQFLSFVQEFAKDY